LAGIGGGNPKPALLAKPMHDAGDPIGQGIIVGGRVEKSANSDKATCGGKNGRKRLPKPLQGSTKKNRPREVFEKPKSDSGKDGEQQPVGRRG